MEKRHRKRGGENGEQRRIGVEDEKEGGEECREIRGRKRRKENSFLFSFAIY